MHLTLNKLSCLILSYLILSSGTTDEEWPQRLFMGVSVNQKN